MNRNSTEREDAGGKRGRNRTGNGGTLRRWNLKLHIWLGLFFLLHLWFFSLSGLLLNNPEWSISNFWPDREVTVSERSIEAPPVSGDLAVAGDLMRQLGLRGEIYRTGWEGEERFSTQVRVPGRIWNVEADLSTGRATVEQIRVDSRGVIRMLHLFTGRGAEEPADRRTWILTRIWSFSMDALSIGLILIVLSGIWHWHQRSGKRKAGWLILTLGVGLCAFFLLGLSLLYPT